MYIPAIKVYIARRQCSDFWKKSEIDKSPIERVRLCRRNVLYELRFALLPFKYHFGCEYVKHLQFGHLTWADTLQMMLC